MPIYEYRRPDGTTFELQQSFSDDPLKVDPDSGVPVERVLHAPAVHFKGKGFYNTDYGTRNRQRETAAAAAAEKSSGEKSSGEKSSGEKTSGEKSSGEKSSAEKPSSGGSASEGKRENGAASKSAGSKPVASKS
jgi:putative FmdB family regulatory protein